MEFARLELATLVNDALALIDVLDGLERSRLPDR